MTLAHRLGRPLACLAGAAALLAGCAPSYESVPAPATVPRACADPIRTEVERERHRWEIIHQLPQSEVLWDVALEGETITRITALRKDLYVETASGTLYCLDKASGVNRWQVQFDGVLDFAPTLTAGTPDAVDQSEVALVQMKELLRTEKFKSASQQDPKVVKQLSDNLQGGTQNLRFLRDYDIVFCICRGRLWGVDREYGTVLWKATLPFVPSAGVGGLNDMLFVPNANTRRVVGAKYNPGMDNLFYGQPFMADDIVTHPPVYVDPAVYFTSMDGGIYCYNISGNLNWMVRTEKAVSTAPVLTNAMVFVGSQDYAVYGIHRGAGAILWKTELGGPVTRQPVLSAGALFVYADGVGMFALNPFTGEKMWSDAHITRFLAVGHSQYYLENECHQMIGVDPARWEMTGFHELGPLMHHASTPGEQVFYSATQDGYVFACREPIRED